MNAQSQFTRSLFQAYYTVISRSFLLLGIASPAFLAAVPHKGGEEVRPSTLVWFITPPHTWGLLLCYICLSFLYSFLSVLLLLYPSEVMMSSLQVCYQTESGKVGWGVWFLLWCAVQIMSCACVIACVCVRDKRLKVREFRSCIPKTAAFKTQGAQQDNCFLSKGQIHNMHLEFLIITSLAEKIWMNSPRILIWNCFMVAQLHDWNRFSAQNSLVKVNYRGYWNYGRCHDCHYIFFSHPELCSMKMINECLLIY